MSTVFALIYSIFGQNPFGFHLVQVLLHIGNAILIFLFCKQFFKNDISLIIALLFLMHPINTEAVVYVSAIGDTLSIFFGLLALYLTLRKGQSGLATLFIAVLFLMSLLAKEIGVLFLFLSLFLHILYQKKSVARNIILISGVLFIYFSLRLGIAHIGFGNQIAIAPIQTLSLEERLLHIPQIIFFYLRTFFYPTELLTFQTWTIDQLSFADVYIPLLFDICFLGAVGFLFRLLYQQNSYYKPYLFFLGWFLAGTAVLLHIIPLDETVSDRWFYFPIIGLLGMGGVLFRHLSDTHHLNAKFVFSCIFIILCMFSVRVMIRNTNWYSEETLYTHDIAENKNSYQLESGLGRIEDRRGNFKEAEAHYVRATEIFPSAITYANLASYQLQHNYPQKAVQAFIKAHEYKNTNPISWAYQGIARYKSGDKTGAIADVKRAYSISPNNNFLVILETIEKNEPITIERE